jgi:UDP-2,3-diacylglucosamine pyrophosphatase LpxH
MLTKIESEKLVVISDLHLGNPFSKAKHEIGQFLRWAAAQGFDICINGDGLEIAQASFRTIAKDVPEVFQILSSISKKGRKTYYVVGNHDIVLEHFLEDWGAFKVAPFLNLKSGDCRIRIEHGHLYDPRFVKNPELYEFLTWVGGLFLNISPSFYRSWIWWEKKKSLMRAKKTGILGEPPEFREAALELVRRGFDTVILGHTHHAGRVDLGNGKQYLNSGSWLLGTHYIEIIQGKATLKIWNKNMPVPVEPRTP